MSGAATDRAMPVKIAYVAYPGFTALDLVDPYGVIIGWLERRCTSWRGRSIPFAATAV